MSTASATATTAVPIRKAAAIAPKRLSGDEAIRAAAALAPG